MPIVACIATSAAAYRWHVQLSQLLPTVECTITTAAAHSGIQLPLLMSTVACTATTVDVHSGMYC